MLTPLDVQQSQYPVASIAKLTLGFDFSKWTTGGLTLSNPVVTLTDLGTGASYAAGLSGAASINGSVVSQTITGLVAGHSYDLVVGVTVSNGQQPAAKLALRCWF